MRSLGIIYEINENAMGHRVTKSQRLPRGIGRSLVKVQRVYGRDCIHRIQFRSTLMGL